MVEERFSATTSTTGAAVFPLIVQTTMGVHTIERRYLWAAENFAVSRFTLFRRVVIPAELRREYPRNPLFAGEIARVQDEYLHDATASLQSWQTLLGSARERRCC